MFNTFGSALAWTEDDNFMCFLNCCLRILKIQFVEQFAFVISDIGGGVSN